MKIANIKTISTVLLVAVLILPKVSIAQSKISRAPTQENQTENVPGDSSDRQTEKSAATIPVHWDVEIKDKTSKEIKHYDFDAEGEYQLKLPKLKNHKCSMEILSSDIEEVRETQMSGVSIRCASIVKKLGDGKFSKDGADIVSFSVSGTCTSKKSISLKPQEVTLNISEIYVPKSAKKTSDVHPVSYLITAVCK